MSPGSYVSSTLNEGCKLSYDLVTNFQDFFSSLPRNIGGCGDYIGGFQRKVAGGSGGLGEGKRDWGREGEQLTN